MAVGDGLTAERILEAENQSLVNAKIVGDNLVFIRKNLSEINVGSVRGLSGENTYVPKLYSARSLATTSISNGTITTLTGWTFMEGDESFVTYNGTTNFTLTETGFYIINASMTYTSDTAGRRITFIYTGSSELTRTESGAVSNCTPFVEHSDVLTAGTVLTVRAYQSSGAALSLSASPGAHINILRLF